MEEKKGHTGLKHEGEQIMTEFTFLNNLTLSLPKYLTLNTLHGECIRAALLVSVSLMLNCFL